jgi:hypothetical protein
MAKINFGGTGRQPEAITPDGVYQNFLGLDKAYPQGAVWAVGLTIVIGLVLWGVFQFTRFGLATRAASSNEKGAVLLGYSPQLLAALKWVIASVLATVAAIILGPIGGSLTPVGLSALVVASLGAALVGLISGRSPFPTQSPARGSSSRDHVVVQPRRPLWRGNTLYSPCAEVPNVGTLVWTAETHCPSGVLLLHSVRLLTVGCSRGCLDTCQ